MLHDVQVRRILIRDHLDSLPRPDRAIDPASIRTGGAEGRDRSLPFGEPEVAHA